MNQTALITGAAKRLGKAMAFHLAGQGWNIAIHYHSSENEAAEVKGQLSNKFPGQRFEIFRANLADAEEVEKLIPAAIKSLGRIDMLVNNASVFEIGSIGNTSVAFFDQHLNVNLKAPFLLSKSFFNLCKKGMIVNITDTRIVSNKGTHAAYSISKKALWELTKMAALEFGPDIRVNAIAPGLTLPPVEKDESYLERLSEKIAMKRPGGVEPILKSIDFIIGNNYLTGQILFCDGGENLGTTS